MYSFDVNRLSISFEISIEDYTAIEERDRIRNDESEERGDEWDYNKIFLSGILDKIEGVSDTDYNGHFGSYIFFNLLTEDDSPEKREEIRTTIVNYINGWKEFS